MKIRSSLSFDSWKKDRVFNVKITQLLILPNCYLWLLEKNTKFWGFYSIMDIGRGGFTPPAKFLKKFGKNFKKKEEQLSQNRVPILISAFRFCKKRTLQRKEEQKPSSNLYLAFFELYFWASFSTMSTLCVVTEFQSEIRPDNVRVRTKS